VLRIHAEPEAPVRHGERMPQAIPFPVQGAHDLVPRQVAQPQAATLARRIFEVERLSAVLAFEQLHDEF
jgi:hypothetical protein